MNSPSMQLLRTDVLEEAQLLNTLGSICGLCSREKEFDIAPKGLGLLSKLHHSAWAHKRKENAILIAVLLKYTYAPYFNFLNKWMTEGICYDPYGEFQIMEDSKYLSRRDELYWKFAYTENVDDSMRAVPAEISKYSQGILQCGKSIRLLKLCCPELFSLKYIFCNP
ncbi:Gamma-tubulin complex component 6, partial [Stegodyphus mimosarum]